MPTVVALANMKGGVGKTTLCVNLAFQIFEKSKKRILVVDNDPQFNATSGLMAPQLYIDMCLKKRTAKTIYNIYEKPPRLGTSRDRRKIDPKSFIMNTWYMDNHQSKPVLDLIPSRIELYETLMNPSSKEYLLDNFLKTYAQNYDYIFIDCPPTPSILTRSAFAASDYIIIPVTPDYYATLGLPQFLGTLSDFKSDLVDSHGVQPLGVVFTNVERSPSDETKRSMEQVKSALQKYSKDLTAFDSLMYHFKVYQKSIWQSRPVQKIEGPGTRGKSLAEADLDAIAEELAGRIKKSGKSK